jgi:hypothetical protein
MIKLMKNPNNPIGNPTREIPACNSVPQQTAPPLPSLALYGNIIQSNL